ncbi:unnamed protein product, partial [Sphacelaria rigidula]
QLIGKVECGTALGQHFGRAVRSTPPASPNNETTLANSPPAPTVNPQQSRAITGVATQLPARQNAVQPENTGAISTNTQQLANTRGDATQSNERTTRLPS